MIDWKSWNYCEQAWNIWKSFLKWRFPWRCCRRCLLSSFFSSLRHREKEMRAAEKLCTWNCPAAFELRANFNWDKLTSQIYGQAPKRYPNWWRARRWIFASLGRNFTGIGCTVEAQTTVSNSTQCGRFIIEYKKYTVSGVTFSFKWFWNKWLDTVSYNLCLLFHPEETIHNNLAI